ncbi:MFS transporter [soil metagenome]
MLPDSQPGTPVEEIPVMPSQKEPRFKIGYRWRICALLFFAIILNYVDRQVLSNLVTEESFLRDVGLMGADGNLNKELYGYLDAAFKVAFVLGFLAMGKLLDIMGSRRGFTFAVSLWSLGGIGQALVGSVTGLGITRFFLGFGEAGNLPASVKTVSEWFPKKERSFATGIFNAGANVGAVVAPLFVAYFVINFTWHYAFVVSGLLGFVWIFFWLRTYKKPEEHPSLSQKELSYIRQGYREGPQVKVPWLELFSKRQTWAYAVGKFLSDPIWFIYMIWLPTFFKEEHGVDLQNMFVPMLIIYLISDVGSVMGGWLSTRLIDNGWSVGNARKFSMFACALLAVPAFVAATTQNIWLAIILIGFATAAHQGFMANLYTMISDCFPSSHVASVAGIGSTFGAIGGVIMSGLSGLIYAGYGPLPLFLIGSFSYLFATGMIHLLNPKYNQAI